MSEQAASAPRLRNVPGLKRNIAIGSVVALGVVGLVAWGAFTGERAVTVRPHLPDLALVAAAPMQIKVHLTAALVALAIGIVLLSGVKGSRLHKMLGWTWVVAMGVTAISSFWIHRLNPGGLSFIHFLSGWTVIGLPAAVFAIKRRKVAIHARAMTSMFVGGLVLAGLLAFLPGRLLFEVFF
ncbi:MAG: hypothetical protein BGN86_12820 [Caulobacterales bacterium 68-7]|nr:DUF2306 domain-containing protein [Caulobacterales bacterium]OJU12495.1 MAG: hypothetical protein BGN86_12820 [Caulobacterales bacterium 68-7]